ncbi:Hypothetical predicted protein [Pelobates cultripes]|uniref:Uncharacterized protein n=1 Tax=Pelobates cultripes TaxID=61616 RepID=A0AAD1TD69_PELCU|nr:Hypothetical predicted protein [Pelobates cultripes]
MVAADRASEPPHVQPLSAQPASEHTQEDRIAAAFDLFWTRWQAILAQNQAATQLPTTSPASIPALKCIAMPPTNTKRQRATRALPRFKNRRPSTQHRKCESRRARRATKCGRPLYILKWCTRWAYSQPTPGEAKKACQRLTHMQRCTAANSTPKGCASASRGHTKTHTHQTARGAEKLPRHQGTQAGPGGSSGVPLTFMTRDAEAPWNSPVCARPVPTTGVG